MRKFFKKVFTIVNLLILLILVILTILTAILISQKNNKQETRSRAAVNFNPIITSKDRRFGVGGNRARAVILGVGTYYGWDRDLTAENPPNDLETFYTVGKIDGGDAIMKQSCDEVKVNQPAQRCTLLWNDANGDGILEPGSPSTLASYIAIHDTIVTNNKKGRIWAVANEPDWFPYILPEDYAKWYHAFYTEIKKWDPTAKVMIGGIHSPDAQYVYQNNNYIHSSVPDDYNYGTYGWIQKWRDSYISQYVTPPTVDIWNIHDYPDDDTWIAYPKDQGGMASALSRAETSINTFHNFLTSISESSKPVWISEFGLLEYKIGSFNDNEYDLYWNYYLSPLLDWIRTQKNIQRVFPFWTSPNLGLNPGKDKNGNYIDYWSDYVGSMKEILPTQAPDWHVPTVITDFVKLGRSYNSYILNHTDLTPPLTSLASHDIGNHVISFSLLDTGNLDTQSGITAYELGYSSTPDSLPGNWKRTYTTSSSVQYNYSADPEQYNMSFIFIRAFDAAGNISAPITVNIPLPPPPTATPKFYNDVPWNHWAEGPIDALYPTGIISQCAGITPPKSQPAFCPDNTITRAQIAVYLLKSKYGPSYAPPPAAGNKFNDIAQNYWAASWIEDLYNKGITAGCDDHKPLPNYCPDNLVTRDTIPILFLKTFYGGTYQPNHHDKTPFSDVPLNFWSADWILQFNDFGIISGCTTSAYCPSDKLIRAQLAVILGRINTLPSLTPTLPPPPPSVTPTLTPLPTPTTVIPSNTPLPPSPTPTPKRKRPSPTPTGSF